MTRRLDGRTALITGGARGMGRAMALRFADEGAAAVIIGFTRSEDEASSTVAELSDRGCLAKAVRADVGVGSDVVRMFEQVREWVPRLDILVNNAGMLVKGALDELPESDWDRTMDVNLKAPFLCTQAALPSLRASEHAVVLNVASGGAGMRGIAPKAAHYYAAKAGLITLSKCLATELAPIRVNCLAPGFTDTGFGGGTPATREKVLATTPLGRVGHVEDVARAAAFLASDEAEFITGHVLTIDGGRTL